MNVNCKKDTQVIIGTQLFEVKAWFSRGAKIVENMTNQEKKHHKALGCICTKLTD